MDKAYDIIYLHKSKRTADGWGPWAAERKFLDDVKYLRADTVKMMDQHTRESIVEGAVVDKMRQIDRALTEIGLWYATGRDEHINKAVGILENENNHTK